MALLAQRIARGLIPARFSADRPPARRRTPDRIVLGVRPGERPSNLPPVRIFLGTERGQFRAERTFLWSVEKHRDPGRIYEIHLLRDLKGFRRRFWLTGFTNYRFAIPEFAGFSGRAIYNDADQVYLTDPAELFDTPMGKAGFLSINDRDTSVMLIDCARMADAWNAHDVRRLNRKKLEARARGAGLWGELDENWNARDSEYVQGESKLVHFTTLHTQPWRPFPEQFVYFPNPTGSLWSDLEHESIRTGFMPVSATRPSRDWAAFHLSLSSHPDGPRLQALLTASGGKDRVDQLKVSDWLVRVPDADVPWVLERLFRVAGELNLVIDEPRMTQGGRYRRSLSFWLQQLALAEQRHPTTSWTLDHRDGLASSRRFFGGPAVNGKILVLLHRKPGHNQQARAIAGELSRQTGRKISEFRIETSEAGFILRDFSGLVPVPEDLEDCAIIVAGGWLPCRYARALSRIRPELRLILSGRKAGPPPIQGGVVIQCRHFGLPPSTGRLLTTLPLNSGLAGNREHRGPWAQWNSAPRRIALLVGGNSRSHRLDPAAAETLARQVSAWASQQKARLLVVTSRRSQAVLSELAAGLAEDDLLYAWRADDDNNPYHLALNQSDCLVVTGESESMLADAVGSGQSVLVWALQRRSEGLWQRLSKRIAGKAIRPHFNRRGSIRPQQGLTYLCARLIERNRVLPPRDTEQLLQELYQSGLAAPFGQPVSATSRLEPELPFITGQAAELLAIDLNPGLDAAATDGLRSSTSSPTP